MAGSGATPAEVRAALPGFAPGLRIGLFGGSFDPPHEGHRMVSCLARRRLGLDQVWWLVSPHNPLKPHAPEADLERRRRQAELAAGDPAVRVTAIEAVLGIRYTADLVAWLAWRMAGVDLVWIMGADNLAQFHRWRDWRRIAATVPIAVVDRPGHGLRAIASPAAQALVKARVPEAAARALPGLKAPAWVFLHGRQMPISSSGLRATGTRRRRKMS